MAAMSEDWKTRHVKESEKAVAHELVQGVMAELRDNLGVSDTGLPAYGIAKVALYAAQIARAQALGFDPDLLRLTESEATSEQLRLAAEAVFSGIPVVTFDLTDGELRP